LKDGFEEIVPIRMPDRAANATRRNAEALPHLMLAAPKPR
jgi:hypothetical protein